MKVFDPQRVLELMENEKIDKMVFPPTVWNFILQIPDVKKRDTSSVRSIASGAEAMPLETKKKLLDLFPNAKLGETYGMTECAATITSLKSEYALQKLDSVGQAFTNVELKLVDDNEREVKLGEVGEILVRGPHVMVGYYKDEDATREALKNGWLHTGDLGIMDKQGFLKIVDRKKDMIVTGAENIYPREIEEVLYRHPKILEAAVVGLKDAEWGERVHAVVALKDGKIMTKEEVIEYCKENLASFKKPKSVEFIDRLPRSSAGKVLKRVLRDQHT
jgi:acyl-CoA synthetase (AMP-forming)/AMP-acid ligase II